MIPVIKSIQTSQLSLYSSLLAIVVVGNLITAQAYGRQDKYTCPKEIKISEYIWPDLEEYAKWEKEGVLDNKIKGIIPAGISQNIYFSFMNYFDDSVSISLDDSLIYTGWVNTDKVTSKVLQMPIRYIKPHSSSRLHAKLHFVMHNSGICARQEISLVFIRVNMFYSEVDGLVFEYTNMK